MIGPVERPGGARKLARRLVPATALLALSLAAGGWRPAAADGPAEPERARVVDPSGRPLDGGGSSTEFTLRLPEGASCPGDSANDGYRVNSYMVPITVDPGSVAYDGLGPTPLALGAGSSFVQPLYDIATNSFVSAQTADARAPGEPGPIVNLPSFSFAVFAPGDVPPGSYHVGLTCTLLNDVAEVWDAEVVVTAAPDDAPAQIRWTVAGGEPRGGGPGTPTAAIGGLAALVAIALTIRGTRRRRSPAPLTTISPEDR